MRIFRFAATACALFGAMACGIHSTTHTCGTEVPDQDEIVMKGCAETDGGGPAIGVRVTAVAKSGAYSADSGAYLATTDETGFYYFTDKLPEGTYNLLFEDSSRTPTYLVSDVKRPGTGHLSLPVVTLKRPQVVTLRLLDAYSGDPLPDLACRVDGLPDEDVYIKITNDLGLAFFPLPAAQYVFLCRDESISNVDTVWVDFPGAADTVVTVYLGGNHANLLPQPATLSALYDTNTGVVALSWPKVKGIEMYGIYRIEPAMGGGAKPILIYSDTTHDDAAFAKADSVQQKTLIYQVFSLSSSHFPPRGGGTDTVRAERPAILGPRIDSLALLPADSGYHVGDTVRIEAAWRNLARGNDTLYWQVKGHPEIQAVRSHPAASGKDTLAFPLQSAGGLEIGIMVIDSQGYRSWLSKSFPFYGNP